MQENLRHLVSVTVMLLINRDGEGNFEGMLTAHRKQGWLKE
jgi:hypothetical protein